jgi:hypothetical protein
MGGGSVSDDGPTWIVLREQWLELVDEDVLAAVILEQMLQWQCLVIRKEDRGEWFKKSARGLASDLMDVWGHVSCSRRLNKLRELGLLESRETDDPRDPKEWRVKPDALKQKLESAEYAAPEFVQSTVFQTETHPVSERNASVSDVNTPVSERNASVSEMNRSTDTNNVYTPTSTSESASACENSEPEPDTEPDDPNDLAADGGSKLEDDPGDSEAADDLSAYEQLFELDEPTEFVEALADFHGVPVSSPGTLWMQACGNASGASEEQLRAYLDAKFADLAADERDFRARTIQKYVRQDASDWEEVIGESDDRSTAQRERHPGQLDEELGRDEEFEEVW